MIVGTAGHIDHGKTSLVKALTGVDADRLKEEKERGITIDLGFAYQKLPNGDVLGFVDAPGHERFVHTMLAGAAGIDFALLVVAADDGIMPQTREHLQILDLLGLSHGLIALTKVDLVDESRRFEVESQIRAALAGTGLAAADILPVSTVTGEGVTALRARLMTEGERLPRREATGAFRFAVDRSFSLSGAGTIVTGAIFSGRVRVGDQVTALPQGLEARVRALHAQNRPAEEGVVGQRCALNLTGPGVTKDALNRGDWISAPTHRSSSLRFDAELKLLSTETKPMKLWTPVHLHVGASHKPARVVLLSEESLAPGAVGLVQIVLETPLPVRHGDRIVLRDASAQRTIGGGRVLDPRAPERRRRSPERRAVLDALRATRPDEALDALSHLPSGVVNLSDFTVDWSLTAADADGLAARLSLIALNVGETRHVATQAAWSRLRDDIDAILTAFHAANPELPGLPSERLRLMLTPRWPRDVFGAALLRLAKANAVALQGHWARLPGHTATLNAEDSKLWTRMRPLIAQDPFKPPRVRDMANSLGSPEPSMRRVCKALVRMGELIEVAHDHFFLRMTVSDMAEIARELSEKGEFNAAAFRDRLDNGRKVAIQILEYFDRQGFTLRRGDLRLVVREPERIFGAAGS